jgi:alginate O-acetyltransferase complex protein AlgI
MREKTLASGSGAAAKAIVFVYDIICAIIPVILIVVSAMALAGDSYNPFLYFQF